MEAISETDIPTIHQGGSYKYNAVLEAASSWKKGAGVRFTVASRSSVTTLKKQLAAIGCDLATRTIPDPSGKKGDTLVQVYAYRPKNAKAE